MANPKEDIKKQVDPSVEEMKKQTAAYEELKKKASLIEELNQKTSEYEELKRQARALEGLKKRISPSYPEDVPYSTQIRMLREKLDLLASNPNPEVHEITHCINAITFFENQQISKIAELRQDAQKTTVFFSDNQSILQTSSVRKKDKEALVTSEPVRTGVKA
jgi:predicted nuclease with TOPRIM domain